jgi:uncharacterized membrane protein
MIFMANSFKTNDLTKIGMFAAFMFVATWIHIPIYIGYSSMIHLGTAALLISSTLLKPKHAFLAAAIGMSLFDLLDPAFIAWAPFTFIIKGSMAFVVSFWISKNGHGLRPYLIAFSIGALISVVGYYIAGSLIVGNWIAPLTHIPNSLITSAIGIAISIPLSISIGKVSKKISRA